MLYLRVYGCVVQALVHVSTAYSNAERRHIEERVYEAPAQLAGLRAMLDALPPSLLDDLTARYTTHTSPPGTPHTPHRQVHHTPHRQVHHTHLTARYIAPKPNTYVFSKAVAEATIAQRPRKHYATAIVRPSIVVSSHRHPFPGWIENLAGPSGVVVGSGKGLVHAFNLDLDARADLIPNNLWITRRVVWQTLVSPVYESMSCYWRRSPEVRVYNSCSQQNPITWRAFRDRVLRSARTHPFDQLMYYPFTFGVKNRYVYKALELVLQTIPLHIADYLARICGIKLHWDEHVTNFVKGTRKYLLKEKDDNIPRARKMLERLRRVHQFVLLSLSVLLYRLLMLVLPRALLRGAAPH
ncbi:hypothetical protein HF086_017809 [Spodoptera exigua]|uniref:Fatty acyl-CoA reductase n=1 Tax=Spodoptera exigua TaxID=7107 RepID=A0A922MHI8_SPOEX|nr:hypothetical protein HF086_017809 [Spodoptera exigua]